MYITKPPSTSVNYDYDDERVLQVSGDNLIVPRVGDKVTVSQYSNGYQSLKSLVRYTVAEVVHEFRVKEACRWLPSHNVYVLLKDKEKLQ